MTTPVDPTVAASEYMDRVISQHGQAGTITTAAYAAATKTHPAAASAALCRLERAGVLVRVGRSTFKLPVLDEQLGRRNLHTAKGRA